MIPAQPSTTSDYTYLHEHPTLLWEAPDRIKRLIERQGKKSWGSVVDFDAALARLKEMADPDNTGDDNLFAVVLNGTHLMVFSVLSPWYAPDEAWIVEQFFIRVAPGPARGAYDALELLAFDYRASRIIMATAFAANDAALGKVYEQYGFRQESTQYVKEASWLQSAPLSQGSPP